MQTNGGRARRGQAASRKSGHDLKHFGVFLPSRSPNPVKTLRAHSSKFAQSLFEHPSRLSLSIRCLMSSFLIVEGLRPSSPAIFGTVQPHPVRVSPEGLTPLVE